MGRDHEDRDAIDTIATTVQLTDGILHVRSKGVESTAESVSQTIAAAISLSDGHRHPVLFDARLWPGGDPSGWLTVINKMRVAFSAGAMIVDPAAHRVLSARFDAFSKLLIPFKVFIDESEARQFIAPYVEVP